MNSPAGEAGGEGVGGGELGGVCRVDDEDHVEVAVP